MLCEALFLSLGIFLYALLKSFILHEGKYNRQNHILQGKIRFLTSIFKLEFDVQNVMASNIEFLLILC